MVAMSAIRGGLLLIPSQVASNSRVGPTIAPVVTDDLARRVTEAKRKVAEVQSKVDPYLVSKTGFVYLYITF